MNLEKMPLNPRIRPGRPLPIELVNQINRKRAMIQIFRKQNTLAERLSLINYGSKVCELLILN